MSEDTRKQAASKTLVKHLQALLANYHIHYQNLRGFHWNVKGPHFFTLHEKFEEYYTGTATRIDEIAERLRALGARPVTRYSDYLKTAQIQEAENTSDANGAVRQIINANEILRDHVLHVLEAAGQASDTATEDTFTPYLPELETHNWMLKAYLG